MHYATAESKNVLKRAAQDALRTTTQPSGIETLPSSHEAQAEGFAYFGRVVVINGDQYVDRMQRMQARLDALGVKFERVAGYSKRERGSSVHQHLTEGYYPLARTHRAIIQRSLELGEECIMILEDDAVLRDDSNELLLKISRQLRNMEWDVFSFGIHLYKDGGPVSENIGRSLKGFHSHAYAVHRRAMPRVVEMIGKAMREGWHYDSFSSHNLIRLYARPIVAIQEPGNSEILGCSVNRLDQYFPPFDRDDFFAHCKEAQGWKTSPAREKITDPVIAETLARAKVSQKSRRLGEADRLYQQVLVRDPENAEALHYQGLLHFQQGKECALELLERSIKACPNSPEYLCNLGMVLGQMGRAAEAIEALDRALAINPNYSEAHSNRGLALERCGQDDEAVAAWRRATECRPEFSEPHNHLGRKLTVQGLVDESIAHLREAIRLNPRHADAHNNMGIALRKAGDVPAAAAAFRRAVELSPHFAEAHANLGTAHNEIGMPRVAIDMFKRAIEFKPEFVDAHWNLAMSLLACGDMEQGWLEYEWRRHLHNDNFLKRKYLQPEWNGCSLSGRTILVICEQGFGDTLQFARYVPLLARRGARIILECQPPLLKLLRDLPGVQKVVARDQPTPRFDTWVRLLSLPGIFNTRLHTVPMEVPYLQAERQRVEIFKSRLTGNNMKVGIAWQGNRTFPNDRSRSIPLKNFAPLAGIEGVSLYSLQKHDGIEQLKDGLFTVNVFDSSVDHDGGFLDTAAIMKNLDMVITSDTAIAHLAGGLGVNTWVALATNCDWRWLTEGEATPWYPTMTLFRQEHAKQWDAVFQRMALKLRELLLERKIHRNDLAVRQTSD